jgi:hypothetical protein
MSPTYNVLRCSSRHDGAYLVTYRKPLVGLSVAISLVPMEAGEAFTLDGERCGYGLAVPRAGVRS